MRELILVFVALLLHYIVCSKPCIFLCITFRDTFPDCDGGAMPPFGNLYGMEVFVAESLAEDEEIVFNAGTHTELMRLAYRDFARLVQPRLVR